MWIWIRNNREKEQMNTWDTLGRDRGKEIKGGKPSGKERETEGSWKETKRERQTKGGD
jgi:hypothetical protein